MASADSLVSVNLPVPTNEEGLPHPTAIFMSHPVTPEIQTINPNQLLVQPVPTFQFTPADNDSEYITTSPDLDNGSISSLLEGSGLLQPKGAESKQEERPQSVLSIIRRPLSSLSKRARSALSKQDIFPNVRVKNLVHKFATRFRSNHHSKVNDDGSDLSDDSSFASNPEGSVQSFAVKRKLDSLAGSEYGDSDSEEFSKVGGGRRKSVGVRMMKRLRNPRHRPRPTCKYHIDPHGSVFLFWMGVVSLAFIYNAVAIPLRASFGVYQSRGLVAWFVLDYLFDIVYLMDILTVQFHLSYRTNGVLEPNLNLIAVKYVKTWKFWFDILSLLPLDVLYAVPELRFNSLLRLPRLLKVGSMKVFQDRFESWTHFPHAYRMVKLVSYFLYIIHIYTCIYYGVSKLEGLGINEWVYDGNGTDYLRCFYWATVTVITSNDREERNPTTTIEYVVEMLGYLVGLFVLAIIIGEIRNIVEAANVNKLDAYRKWDRVKEYIQLWNIPKELQDRIQSWYDNVLITQQYVLDESRVLDTLPVKMKADLAIHVHLDTLCKVALFQDCEKPLLRELVLKLRPVLFVPGDYICRKGEIGKEMYIVNHGQVEVVSGAGNNEVLAELGPGAVFGEISLLAVGGGNRRTAHVRSKGFAKLFVLDKKDLHDTLVDYPDAQETMKRKAKHVLRKDKKRERRQSMAQQQQDKESLMAKARLANKVRSHGPAKAAVTALTTAARAARARAAASKLMEEGQSAHLSNGSKHITHVEIHPAPCLAVDSGRGMAFEMVSPKTKGTAVPPSAGHQQQCIASETVSTCTSKPGIMYSTLWPSAKDVVIATNDPNTLLPSMASIETTDIGFLSEDSLIG